MLVSVDDKILYIERHVFLTSEDGEHTFTEKCSCCMNHLDKFESKYFHSYTEQWVSQKVYVHNPFGKYNNVKYKTRTFGEGGIILDNETLRPI